MVENLKNQNGDTPLSPFVDGQKTGRTPDGRFAQGNSGGPGNPHVAAVAVWRAALIEAVSADDIRAVMAVLIQQAKEGKPWAVREFLDRALGKPQQRMELGTGEKTWAVMLAALKNDMEYEQ